MLESHDRDADDLVLGFVSSRFDNAEDGEETRVKVSVWGDDDDGEVGGDSKSKANKGPEIIRKSNDTLYSLEYLITSDSSPSSVRKV